MVTCPFCQFANEDGVLFCEQCKSDLGVAQAEPLTPVPAAAFYQERAAAGAPTESVPTTMPAGAPSFDCRGTAAPPSPEAIHLASAGAPAPELSAAAEAAMAVRGEIPPVAAPMTESPAAELVVALPAESQAPAIAGTAPDTIPGVPVAAHGSPVAPEVSVALPAVAPVDAESLPAGAQPRLVVLRGQKINAEYPIYEGLNFIGRADEQPVDIDLEDQETSDRIWSSRQHAVMTFENGKLIIEDLNSSNGTFVNRARIYPGQKRPLKPSDVIQIGTVQLKVKA
jgi:hypothetical protein